MRRMLAFSLVFLLGLSCLGLAQQLSGSWDVEIDIDPQQTDFSNALAMSSLLKISYSIGDWTFSSATLLDEDGWVDQDFSTTGILGPFTLTAAIDFNPDATFGSLLTTTSVSFGGVLFGSKFTLEGNDTFFKMTASGSAGDVNINLNINFGDNDDICDFPFDEASVRIGFPFYCTEISSTLTIGCTGFDSITFSTPGIAIPNLPWLTIGARLVYTLQTKSLTLSPTFDFGTVTCIDFYIAVDTSGNLNIGAITLEGIKLSSNLGPVTFTGISFWGDGGKPGRLAGRPYWEVYTIESNVEACCGPLSFDVSVFFLENGIRLFDISMIEAELELTLAPQFTFNMGLKVDVEINATTIWTLGFETTW